MLRRQLRVDGAARLASVAGAASAARVPPAPAPGAGAGARMLAWRVHAYSGALGELRLEEARVPALRAPDELLVRVHAASLNPLDVAMLGGYGSRVLNALRALDGGAGEGEGVEFPLVCGRDFVGEVVAAGAGAGARLRRGRRVWGVVPPHRAGAHAQYVAVRAAWAGPAPRALDAPRAGGALYAALTACAALRAAGLPAGEPAGAAPRVLLLGLGGVGRAALQLLVHAGARVSVGCAGECAERALALGAAAALDRHAPEYARRLEEGGPYEAIVDCAGLGGWEASARRWRYARYVTLTTPLLREAEARGVPAGAAAAAAALAGQCARALLAGGGGGGGGGGCGGAPVRWAYFAPRAADIELVRRLAERGQFVVDVERVYGWWEGAEAYARMARGSARGKLVLDFSAAPPAPPAPPAHP